jgi:histidyl-tRNA synthetase
MRRADKIGAHHAVIIGDNELANATVALRDLKTSTQSEVAQADLVAVLTAAAAGGRGA